MMKLWDIKDPNGNSKNFPDIVKSYRPIRIGPEDKNYNDCLYVGDAAKDKSVLQMAKFIVYCVNNALMTHNHVKEMRNKRK
jgi:hypothetical protein